MSETKGTLLLHLLIILISLHGFSQKRIIHECGSDMHGKPKIFTKTQLQVARQAMMNPANHLTPNQYHIIEKQTQSGNTTSTTIYKN